MNRYERKVQEHQTVIESMHAAQPISEIMLLTRELIEQQTSQMCDKILIQINCKVPSLAVDSSNDYRFHDVLDGDEVYQSTCSNSLQRSQSNMKYINDTS